MAEITARWFPITGARHYEMTRDGRVRSVDRYVEYKDGRKPRFFPGVELKLKVDKRTGYHLASIRMDEDPGHKWQYVHGLLCEMVHGPRPTASHEARHLNDNKLDNRAENLTWGTRSENAIDTVRNGNHPLSRRTHCVNGHRFSGHGKVASNGQFRRICKRCASAASRRSYLRKRASWSDVTRLRGEKPERKAKAG